MSADQRKPWPLMYRNEVGKPDTPFSGIANYLSYLESCGEGVWRCHELDRSDAEGRPTFSPTAAKLLPFATEMFIRQGNDSARRFVAAVLRGDFLDEEHASLMANVRRRFGDDGLDLFAFSLEMFCDGLDDDIADVERGGA